LLSLGAAHSESLHTTNWRFAEFGNLHRPAHFTLAGEDRGGPLTKWFLVLTLPVAVALAGIGDRASRGWEAIARSLPYGPPGVRDLEFALAGVAHRRHCYRIHNFSAP